MSTKEKKVKKVQARHILVATKELAEDIKKKLDDGDDFAKLAEQFSECPSKKRGGDLGWFGKGSMVRAFEVAAFSAEEGAIVGPLKTEFGWHVIYVYEIKDDIDPDAGPPTGDEDADDKTLLMVAENYAHEFLMLGYSSKKVFSLFTSAHFKSANAVYNILGADAINEVIAGVFGQRNEKPAEKKPAEEKPAEEKKPEEKA